MFSSPDFWVAVALVAFLLILAYFRVFAAAAKMLDDRGERIRNELGEAQRLREEAQAMLAEARRRQREAEQEAQEIITQAREEAKLYQADERRKFKTFIERRRELAEMKIAQAQEHAVKEVRTSAAELAVAAAASVLADEVKGKKAEELVEDSITLVKKELH